MMRARRVAYKVGLAEFLTTTDRAAACLPDRDGDLHAATSAD